MHGFGTASFGLRPQISRAQKHPQWHRPVVILDDRMFGMLNMLHYRLKPTASASQRKQCLTAPLNNYPDVPAADTGFPVASRYASPRT